MKNLKTFEGFFSNKKQKSEVDWSELEIDELESRGFELQNNIYSYIPDISVKYLRKITIEKIHDSYGVHLKMSQIESDTTEKFYLFDEVLQFIDNYIPKEEQNFRNNLKKINEI
jgi:hypothetical protein